MRLKDSAPLLTIIYAYVATIKIRIQNISIIPESLLMHLCRQFTPPTGNQCLTHHHGLLCLFWIFMWTES